MKISKMKIFMGYVSFMEGSLSEKEKNSSDL